MPCMQDARLCERLSTGTRTPSDPSCDDVRRASQVRRRTFLEIGQPLTRSTPADERPEGAPRVRLATCDGQVDSLVRLDPGPRGRGTSAPASLSSRSAKPGTCGLVRHPMSTDRWRRSSRSSGRRRSWTRLSRPHAPFSCESAAAAGAGHAGSRPALPRRSRQSRRRHVGPHVANPAAHRDGTEDVASSCSVLAGRRRRRPTTLSASTPAATATEPTRLPGPPTRRPLPRPRRVPPRPPGRTTPPEPRRGLRRRPGRRHARPRGHPARTPSAR